MGPREFHEEIASTQDRALELARTGTPDGTRVVARRQTRGRGRLDHRWASPPGGLYLSIVLAAPADHSTLLPLGVGAHLADGLGRAYGRRLAVKWPNDVLATDVGPSPRKLAGVLVDRVPSPREGFAVVVGVGVNVATAPDGWPPATGYAAAALAERSGPPPSLDDVEELVVAAVVGTARSLGEADGVGRVRALTRAYLYGVGRRAVLDGRPVGTIAALGDEGELLVDRDGDRVAIRAGDLRVEGWA